MGFQIGGRNKICLNEEEILDQGFLTIIIRGKNVAVPYKIGNLTNDSIYNLGDDEFVRENHTVLEVYYWQELTKQKKQFGLGPSDTSLITEYVVQVETAVSNFVKSEKKYSKAAKIQDIQFYQLLLKKK